MAKKDNNYKERFSSFADRIKTEVPEVNTQTVVPTKDIPAKPKAKVEKEEEVQISLYLPKSLTKKLKLYTVENEMSMKDVIIKAIEGYIAP